MPPKKKKFNKPKTDEKKVLPGFLHSHERDESIVLFRDVKKKSREEAEDRDFSLLCPRKVFQ